MSASCTTSYFFQLNFPKVEIFVIFGSCTEVFWISECPILRCIDSLFILLNYYQNVFFLFNVCVTSSIPICYECGIKLLSSRVFSTKNSVFYTWSRPYQVRRVQDHREQYPWRFHVLGHPCIDLPTFPYLQQQPVLLFAKFTLAATSYSLQTWTF